MLEKEIQRILSETRRMPNPYRGHPMFFFGANRFPKGFDYRWDGEKRRPSPWHPQLVFQYTLSGWGRFSKQSKSHRINSGQAFFTMVPSTDIYELPPESPGWGFFFLTFQHPYIAERIAQALKTRSGVVTLGEEHPLILKSVDLIRLSQSGLFADSHEEEAHLLDWMCCAERTLEEEKRPQREKNIWLTRVRTCVEQNLGEPPSVEELARQYNLSRSHFTRLFKQSTGISPAVFITRLRLHHAEEKLRLSDATLHEIALDLGYADSNHFCKVFKRQYGVTPGELRKQLRNS